MDLEVTLPSGGARRLHIPSLHDDITGATLRKKQVHMWGGGLGCLFALKCGLITSFFHSALYISLWDFQQCWPMQCHFQQQTAWDAALVAYNYFSLINILYAGQMKRGVLFFGPGRRDRPHRCTWVLKMALALCPSSAHLAWAARSIAVKLLG